LLPYWFTSICYLGTGVEVKPGQSLSCDVGKEFIIHLSQVYAFPSLSIFCLFVSTILLKQPLSP
jgi:hypothetical protein